MRNIGTSETTDGMHAKWALSGFMLVQGMAEKPTEELLGLTGEACTSGRRPWCQSHTLPQSRPHSQLHRSLIQPMHPVAVQHLLSCVQLQHVEHMWTAAAAAASCLRGLTCKQVATGVKGYDPCHPLCELLLNVLWQ